MYRGLTNVDWSMGFFITFRKIKRRTALKFRDLIVD